MSTPDDQSPLLVNADSGPSPAPRKRSYGLLHPRSFVFRFIVLFFICLLSFGSYYVYDNPAALQSYMTETECVDHIEKKTHFDEVWCRNGTTNATVPFNQHNVSGALRLSSLQFESLYAVYSFPNMVQVFFGGWLIDRFLGIRFGSLMFCGFVVLGQLIFAIGVQFKQYWCMVLGRTVFGLGGESLSVAQNTYVAKWFKGNELAFAFGITLSTSRVGSAVNFNLEPIFVSLFKSLPIAVWVGAIICLVSLLACLVLNWMDARGDRLRKQAVIEDGEEDVEVKAGDPVSLLDVLYFPWSTWFIYAICVTFYVSVFVFVQIASDFLGKRYGFSPSEAGRAVSIIYLFSAVGSPILGYCVDKIGRSLFWLIIASIGMTCSHLLLIFFPMKWIPYVALLLMGASYSTCAAALWPGVALIVEQDKLGTAYGLMTALQNTGLALAPLLVGWMTSNKTYKTSMIFFACCSASAAVLSTLLVFVDLAYGGLLNASGAATRARLLAAEQKAADDKAESQDPSAKRPVLGAMSARFATRYDVAQPQIRPRDSAQIRRGYLDRLGLGAGAPPGGRYQSISP